MGFFIDPYRFGTAAKVLTYQTSAIDASNLTTYTFSTQSIGTEASDRRVIVGVVGGDSNRTVSTLTVGGVSATFGARFQSNNATSEVWVAHVPTGTTGDVVVTWSGSQGRSAISVWSATGLTSDAIHASSGVFIGNSSPTDVSVDTLAGGFVVFVVYRSYIAGIAGSLDYTTATKRYDNYIESFTTVHSVADATTTGGNRTIQYNDNGGTQGNSPGLLVAF